MKVVFKKLDSWSAVVQLVDVGDSFEIYKYIHPSDKETTKVSTLKKSDIVEILAE